jgi:curved DNA-binding protein CbpA
VYRAGVMSKVDPKGYYACLGVEPWANTDQIRAAYHRGARLYHPDHNPSPQAKARFQAINEAYRTLSNPSQRAAYDSSWWTDHNIRRNIVRWKRTDLDVHSFAPRVRKLAQFVGVGAFGLTLLVLLFEVAVGPHGSELFSSTSSPLSSAFSTRLALEPQKSPAKQAPVPEQVASAPAVASAPSPPSPALSNALAPSRPAPLEAKPGSGAWRDKTKTALVAEPPQGTGSPALAETGGPVQEEPLPPPRPRALHSGLGDKAINDLPPDEVGNAAPEPRPAAQLGQVGAEQTLAYVGAWARSRADCFQETDAPPLAISAQRAESFGGLEGSCEFAQVQRDGAGWRTRARCSAHGKSWTANVQLRVTGSTLSWSSERGRATYYRCPPRVRATE